MTKDVSGEARRPAGDPEGGQWTSGGSTSLMSRLTEPDGGFTYQPLTGDEPKEGFAVSPYPDRSFAKGWEDFTSDDLARYAKRNKDLFKKSGHYMGAWHDPESGKVFLDVSIVSKDARVANRLALAHDQIAYFDLKTGKSITVNKHATSGGVIKR